MAFYRELVYSNNWLASRSAAVKKSNMAICLTEQTYGTERVESGNQIS